MRASKNLEYCVRKLGIGQFLSKEMLNKLEKLSALKIQSADEIKRLEEEIRLADRIFDVDTIGVEPLHLTNEVAFG